MSKAIQMSYIEAVITCPRCKKPWKYQKPGKSEAVPAGNEFVCADCGNVFEVYLVLPDPRRLTLDEAVRELADKILNILRTEDWVEPAEQTCPYCRGTGVDPMSDIANHLTCPKCGGKSKRSAYARDEPR